MKNTIMKTKTLLPLWLLVAVFCVQSSVYTLHAQQRQDAMYVFRNDGKFNAFFYDDIERIALSMIDTLGALHDSYVVQEFYAMDTVYRIPLSAIDSVSFITPETKYKEGVVKMEESLQNYITAVNGMTLTLAANTPAGLLPKTGTKLALLEVNDDFPYGFAGIVSNVSNDNGSYTVACDSVDLTDLFDQLVIKVAAKGEMNPDVKEARVRRRAEYELGPTHIDLPQVGGSLSLTSSFGFTDQLSADIGASVGFQIKPSLDIRAFLYVGLLSGMQFTSTVRAAMETELSVGISGSFTCHADVPITTIPIPLGQPFIREDIDFGFFGEGQGSLNTTYKLKSTARVYGYTYFDSSLYGHREIDANAKILSLEDEWSALTGKVSISTGIYLEAATVVLKKNVAKASIRGDAGIRIDMEAELKAEDLDLLTVALPSDKAVEVLNRKTLIYDILNRDASLSICGFTDVQAIAKAGSWTTSKKAEETFTLPWGGSGGLVPKFLEVVAMPDPYDDTHATLWAKLGRKTPFPNRIGFTVLDDKGSVVNTFWNRYDYWMGEPGEFEVSATNLQPGIKYTAYPITSFFAWDLPAKPTVEFMTTVEGLQLSQEIVSFEYDETETKVVNIGTNCTNLTVKPEKEARWLTATLVKKTLQLTCTENNGNDIREAVLIVSGLSPKGETITAKLIVSQLPEVHGFLMVKQEDEAPKFMSYNPYYVNTPLHVVPTKEEQEQDGWRPYTMGWAVPLYDLNDDVEDIFVRYRYFKPDEQGNINLVKDGLTMKGTFDKKTGMGRGTFELNTSFQYRQASWDALVNYYRFHIGGENVDVFNSLYEATIAHQVKGTFTIGPSSEGESTYVFTLTGEGTYRVNGTYINEITNWEVNGFGYGYEYPNAQLGTATLSLYPECLEPYNEDGTPGEIPCTFDINKYQLHYRFSE